LTDTTDPEKLPCQSFTIIRPVAASFPIGFEVEVKRRAKGEVKLVKQEQEILSFFLAQLNLVDPDVLIGHQLEGVDFSILLSRLQAKKTPQWSRIGRFKRTTWPSSMGKTGERRRKICNVEMYILESYGDVQPLSPWYKPTGY